MNGYWRLWFVFTLIPALLVIVICHSYVNLTLIALVATTWNLAYYFVFQYTERYQQ